MFNPQFSISEAFKNRLKSMSETNEYLRRLTFTRQKMKELKDEALTTSIFRIIQSEDQRIGYGRVARVLEFSAQKSTDTTDLSILNICTVLKKVKTYQSIVKSFGVDDFLELYYLLKGLPERNGKTEKMKKPYRDSHKDIRENSQRKLYDAAPHGDISLHMTDLFDWLTYESKNVHPLIKAILAYFQVIIVRPFRDDNCKMAWFLFRTILGLNKFDFGGYISLEKDIFMSRESFHKDFLHLVSGTFSSGDFYESDFQPYIMFLLPTIENTISEQRLFLDREHYTEVGEILRKENLNERQRKALTYLVENGRITNREYKKLNEITSRKLAWIELSQMVRAEILKDVDRDQGRNAGYEFGPIMKPETVMKHL